MIQQEQRIIAFNRLGKFLREINPENPTYNSLFEVVHKAKDNNGWFSKENVLKSFAAWGELLNKQDLTLWTEKYKFNQAEPKTVGLVLAGNIPLVGFHDVLSVLISGNKALVKCSSSDPLLIAFLINKLQEFESGFNDYIEFTKERFTDFDAVIATGSNNAARYFEYYFSKVPNLIRSNRNGVAILEGNETKEQLEALAIDIIQYYGLGCRSISKVFVPKGYDLNLIFGALYPHNNLMDSAKYANNYDYNKAVYLMSQFDILDNGFFILKEDSSYSSPVACLHYEYYENLEELKNKLKIDRDLIQCVTSNFEGKGHFPFGKAQEPNLWDYADGKNTLDFLNILT
ncbi:MAG: acyl-CoA reductase [Flavobacteriaceae bacterium]|nr:acyl-CoA reductase [Flavobacteriaceae bacterium]